MQGIGTTLRIVDRMTAPILSINNAINTMVANFNEVEKSSNINTSSLDNMRHQVDMANLATEQLQQTMQLIEDDINQNINSQVRFNDEINNGASATNGLMGKISGMVAAYASIQTVKKVLDFSDEISQTNARLNMMNDGLQTTEELQNMIFQSSQRSRGSYTATADTVAKLGILAKDAFSNSAETVAFAEQLNKQFVISGTSGANVANVMTQITQALGSGVLRGDELNSVFENAPSVIQSIVDYLGVSVGEIREMASAGELTADVMKNALLSAAEETNAKFAEMPYTFAQITTMIQNQLTMTFMPLLQAIGNATSWIIENWESIAPVVMRVGTALAVVLGIWTAATIAQKIAQLALNTAMWASPITWIILIVVALIIIIYKVIDAINETRDKSISATGVIFGAFAWLGAAIWNVIAGVINAIIQFLWTSFVEPFISIIEWILNVCNGGFDSFGDAVKNLLGNIISWFLSLGKVVTKIIDAIFGTNWTDGLSSLQNEVLSWGKNENAITLDRETYQLGRISYDAAWNAGYNLGESLETGMTDMFSSVGDYSDLDGIINNTNTIAANTGDMADSLEITAEEIKLWRDIAERDSVNRFTTAELSVSFGDINNNVSSNMDLDGIIDYIAENLEETLHEVAEGVEI